MTRLLTTLSDTEGHFKVTLAICKLPNFVRRVIDIIVSPVTVGWLSSRVVSVLDSGAEGPGFKSQPRRCRVTVLGKLFTPIVPLFTKQ